MKIFSTLEGKSFYIMHEESLFPLDTLALDRLWSYTAAFINLAACRTIHEPAANPAVWPIFQLLFGP